MSQNYRLSRKCNTEGYKFLYDSIKDSIQEKHILNPKPIMIGKIGSTELRLIHQFFLIVINNQLDDFTPDIKREGCNVSGLYPSSKEGFLIFIKAYLDALKSINIMASWNDNILQIEEYVWNNIIINSKKDQTDETDETDKTLGLVELTTLESFYTEPNYWWQNLYENKTILVISPFVKSIQTQLDLSKRDKVWTGKWKGFWSKNITFKYIKFAHPYYISSEEDKAKYPKTLELLMQKYQNEIDKLGDFDIALVGTGAYSILLCDYIKRVKKKNAFHLGGGLQMMFGVYGHRWEPSFNKSPFLKDYMNEHWIRPLAEEIPPMYQEQENGAYF
jgi:hypothetical protein